MPLPTDGVKALKAVT